MALDNYYSDDEATKAVKKYRAALRNLVAAAGPVIQFANEPVYIKVDEHSIMEIGGIKPLAAAVTAAKEVLK